MLFCAWKDQVEDLRADPSEKSELVKSFRLPEFFRKKGDVKGFMAWDGFYLVDPDLHIAQLAGAYMERIQKEASCGQCFPCRVGTRILAELIDKIREGKGSAKDLEKILSLGKDISITSKCTVGQTAPIPVLKSIELMEKEWREQIDNPKSLPKLDSVSSHVTAPCISACPAHQDVPTYVELIRNGRYTECMEVIRDRNMMPGTCGRVCVRPCQSNCRRSIVDSPIRIKRLKRFAFDWEKDHHIEAIKNTAPLTEGPVAIVGAGPAGLACAWHLLQKGVKVHVIEALPRPGGMAAVGIPDYRLPPDILGYEVELIENLGGTFAFNTRVGKDVTLKDLTEQGYKAVFIGIGAHESRTMRIPGEEENYGGFIHGVHFLRAVALGEKPVEGKKIIVVGGGNVAIDCVRTALRLGFDDVNLVYRRSRQEMPADDLEVVDAQEENIKFHFLTTPTRILADENGKVTGVELIKMELGEPDASGRRRPVPMEGSEYVVEADCVIPAIGQSPMLDMAFEESGIKITRWHTLEGNEITGQTDAPYIFTGGDCLTGPSSLISAVAAGTRSAVAIEKFLKDEPIDPDDRTIWEHHLHKMQIFDSDEKISLPPGYEAAGYGHLPVDDRVTHFGEVEEVFSAEASLKEAFRCLRCYRLALFVL